MARRTLGLTGVVALQSQLTRLRRLNMRIPPVGPKNLSLRKRKKSLSVCGDPDFSPLEADDFRGPVVIEPAGKARAADAVRNQAIDDSDSKRTMLDQRAKTQAEPRIAKNAG
jgi:hypothetical protein